MARVLINSTTDSRDERIFVFKCENSQDNDASFRFDWFAFFRFIQYESIYDWNHTLTEREKNNDEAQLEGVSELMNKQNDFKCLNWTTNARHGFFTQTKSLWNWSIFECNVLSKMEREEKKKKREGNICMHHTSCQLEWRYLQTSLMCFEHFIKIFIGCESLNINSYLIKIACDE